MNITDALTAILIVAAILLLALALTDPDERG